jgi:Fe-S oxidoreductase
MTLFELLIIIPFTLGLTYLLIVLSVKYYTWFKALNPKNKLRLWRSLTPRGILSAINEIFRECLLHLRIFRQNKRLWYMHMSLAFGWFLLILAGNIESIYATGRFSGLPWESIFFDYFSRGQESTIWQLQFFNNLMDLLLLFILSGVSLAVYKRFNSRSLGMKRRPIHNYYDRLAMMFLWFIFPVRLIAESLNHAFYGGGGFMTSTFGNLINLPDNYNFLSDGAWVVYSIALGGFFIALPRSRYMHILTEIPHILLKKAHVQAYQDKGATEFQLHACSSCGICLNSCQMTNYDKYQGQNYYYIRNIREADESCVDSTMNCMMCGRCSNDCPVQVDTLSLRMNERIALNDNINYDFSYNDFRENKSLPARIVFFGGCMARLTPGIISSMKKIFDFYGEDYVMVDETEPICCGRPVYLSGQKQAYYEIVKQTRERIIACQPKLIVTSCPICLNSFKNNYFFPVPVIHHTQYLESLIKQGLMLPEQSDLKTIYHDPCELGRSLGIYREPRLVLRHIVRLQNNIYNKDEGLCCGGSVADLEMDFADKQKIASDAIRQLIHPDTQQLATSCPLCKITFKASNIIPVRDIAEIYAESLTIILPVKELAEEESMNF